VSAGRRCALTLADRASYSPSVTPSARALGLSLLLTACGAEEVEPLPPFAHLEAPIREQMKGGGIVGLAAARIEQGETKWIGTFGFADWNARRPVEADTPFLAASISKTLVGTLLLQLEERAQLQLDAPIDETFGGPVPDTSRAITPEMLATHTSGLQDDWLSLGQVTVKGDHPGTLAEFARGYWAPGHFAAAPGARRDYCNAGFGVLGAVIEDLTQETLPALTEALIFEPLGLKDSGWHLRDVDVEKVAVPYSGTPLEGLVAEDHEGYGFYPATSLRISVRDLATFLGAVMERELYLDAAAERVVAIANPEVDEDQAFVWYWRELGEHRYLGHTGSAVGASGLMFFDPETRVGAVVLSNSDAFLVSRFGKREGSAALYAIARAILEASP
jgi:CubicO group peptidase (beta-lactamase class C family)